MVTVAKKPVFSVITPVYNREQCLANAAKSIADQSFGEWEHIIVNDGSSDGTAKVMDALSASDARVKAIHLPCNQGVAAARNAGIEAATGTYMLFLDSDDEFLPGAFAVLYDLLHADSTLDAVLFPIERFDANTASKECEVALRVDLLEREALRTQLLAGLIGICAHEKHHMFRPVLTNKCVKRSLFTDYNIRFDVNKLTWEDGEVCIKVIDQCQKINVIDRPLMSDRTTEVDDHLSMRYYSDGVANTLAQYKWELETFGKEFDFYNEYALEWHFKRIQTWIWRTLAKDKNRKAILLEVLRDPMFILLVTRRTPNGVFEKAVRFFLKRKWIRLAYAVYRLQNRINGGECY